MALSGGAIFFLHALLTPDAPAFAESCNKPAFRARIAETLRQASEQRPVNITFRTSADGDIPGASTVRLGALPELVEHARANGLPTELTVVGDPAEVPELVQVNLYRIAQESLTNARRHGGPKATASYFGRL